MQYCPSRRRPFDGSYSAGATGARGVPSSVSHGWAALGTVSHVIEKRGAIGKGQNEIKKGKRGG